MKITRHDFRVHFELGRTRKINFHQAVGVWVLPFSCDCANVVCEIRQSGKKNHGFVVALKTEKRKLKGLKCERIVSIVENSLNEKRNIPKR